MPEHEPYEVGYKKPPLEHRFKSGRSGNPKGRPKGARSLPEEVRAMLRKMVKINDDGKRRKITVVAAALRRLVEKAVNKGDLNAIKHLLSLADAFGAEARQLATSEEDTRMIESALRRLHQEAEHES